MEPTVFGIPRTLETQLTKLEWSGRSFIGVAVDPGEKKVPTAALCDFCTAPVSPLNFFVFASKSQNKVRTAKMF